MERNVKKIKKSCDPIHVIQIHPQQEASKGAASTTTVNTNINNFSNSENEISSDDEWQTQMQPIRKRKKEQKFRKEWQTIYDWIEIQNDKPYCKYCQKTLSNNITHLTRHTESKMHLRTAPAPPLKIQPAIYSDEEYERLNEKEDKSTQAKIEKTPNTTSREKKRNSYHTIITETSEFEAIGINVAKKLSKMDSTQQIYAESLISDIMKRGLLNELSKNTIIFDGDKDNRGMETSPSINSRSNTRLKNIEEDRYSKLIYETIYLDEHDQRLDK